MTEQMWDAIVARAGAKKKKNGAAALPEGRTLTLYAGHDGCSLQVAKVVSVQNTDGLIEASDAKGEVFLLALDDVYAACLAGADDAAPARKTGFLGR